MACDEKRPAPTHRDRTPQKQSFALQAFLCYGDTGFYRIVTATRHPMTRKDEENAMRRWKLLPEARHHRILFFVVVLIVLAITIRLVIGW